MDKMTKREFYTAIKNGEIDEQVKLFASEELEKMDAVNEKRRNTLSKKAKENEPLLQQITDEILTEEPKTLLMWRPSLRYLFRKQAVCCAVL